ncbi:MAG: hypothetical protein NT015_16935 [Alphaproteobacteria bacterium]|nr:hypothetical protein [Alphaproteobacteria bacterium]
MRSLAVWTTTAVVALLGVANAQTPAATTEAGASNVDLQTAVTAYAAYQSDVSELRASTMRDAASLETALDRVSRHNRDALTRGWIAYGANTAAQSPAFVQGVRDAAAYYGRDAVIWAVTVDPSYARGLRGGQEATAMLLASANADSARIISVADRYQEMAYSLQNQRWANAVAPQQAARVQRVRSLGRDGAPADAVPSAVAPRLTVTPLSLHPSTDPSVYGGRNFWDAVRGGEQVVQVSSTPTAAAWRVNASRGEALDRMAAVAALQALDAVDSNQSAVSRLIADPRSRDCIEMAQLQLYQCMSAARFRYENAFCLGQHGLRDIGTCIGAVAQPETTAMTPIPTTGHGGRD